MSSRLSNSPGDLKADEKTFHNEAGIAHKAQDALNRRNPGLTFIENRGQWDAEARYLVRIGGLNAWVTDTGIVFDFYERIAPQETAGKTSPRDWPEGFDRRVRPQNEESVRGHVVRMEFEGARAASVAGQYRQEGYYNYFIGNDPSRWASNVPLYGEVTVSELYDGIGMRLYEDEGLLRYDLVTAPGADVSQVRLRLDGADAVRITPEGDLAMATSLGEIRQAGLFAFQEVDGRRVAVPAAFRMLDEGTVGLDVEPVDPSLPLVIDPLIYSTFLGGTGRDSGHSIAVDASGHAYVAGWTNSSDFPTTAGAYQGTHPGGWSAYVTKLNPAGTGLVYSTYLGGGGVDFGRGIAVDASGHAYVTGEASSMDFPTTAGAFQESYPGGGASAFVTKLNPAGTGLLYSTYLGGGDQDYAQGIAVDASGHAYVAGWTNSSDFPTTDGAYQGTQPGAVSVFVTKLNPAGSGLVYSTYLGGTGIDWGYGIAVDASGHTYVAGQTESTNFPTTAGAFQESYPGAISAFVTRLNPAGTGLLYSTYLGGTGWDRGRGIAVDASGHAYVAGWTISSNFPRTAGAYQGTQPGDPSAFVTKLNPAGTGLLYSTYLGGTGDDYGIGIAVDASGHAYVAGLTTSTNFPTTAGAYQRTTTEYWSAFVTKLNPAGTGLHYSTYLGGTGDDSGRGISVDASGHAYVAGWTESTNFPTIAGAYQETHPGGAFSAFVTKLLVPTQIALSVSRSFGDATQTSQFRMIGLPGNVDLRIDETLAGESGTDWAAYHDNGNTAGTLTAHSSGSPLRFRPGRGYFVISKNAWNVSQTVEAVQLESDGTYSIPLHNGWNIISNPFTADVNWNTVKTLNAVTQDLHRFEGSYSTTTTLRPYEGYYFFNQTNRSELKIPFPGPSKTDGHPSVAGASHPLRLIAYGEEGLPSEVRAGIAIDEGAPGSAYQFAPPGHFESVSLRLVDREIHPDYPYFSEIYREKSGEGVQFHVLVRGEPGSTIGLRVEDYGPFSNEEVVLVDARSGRQYDLQVQPEISYRMEDEEQRFVLMTGSAAFVREALEEIAPSEFQLFPNFPNPFHTETVIRYSLPEDADVSLVVYDALGRLVRVLRSGQVTAGIHETRWNGRDDSAIPVASGVYIIQLRSGERVGNNKIIVVK